MTSHLTNIISVSTIVILFLTSCTDGAQKLLDNRKQQLANISNHGASIAHKEFSLATDQLQEHIVELVEQPSDLKLEQARQSWITTSIAFKKCELYDIGDINSSFLHPRIYRWPTDSDRIQDTILNRPTMTLDRLQNQGSNLVGIAAIEFLLFREDALPKIKSPKAGQYLIAASSYLRTSANELNTTWQKYKPTFESALESKITGGQNQMTNILVAYLEETSKISLGKALGESNGGSTDISQLEGYMSNVSMDLVKSGFEEWKSCYYGNFENGSDDYGFDDYIIDLGNKDLANRIDMAIKSVNKAINELNDLSETLVNNPSSVQELNSKINKLSILIKNDLAGYIGATITVNDTDGD